MPSAANPATPPLARWAGNSPSPARSLCAITTTRSLSCGTWSSAPSAAWRRPSGPSRVRDQSVGANGPDSYFVFPDVGRSHWRSGVSGGPRRLGAIHRQEGRACGTRGARSGGEDSREGGPAQPGRAPVPLDHVGGDVRPSDYRISAQAGVRVPLGDLSLD